MACEQQTFVSHNKYRGWKSKIMVPGVLVPGEASLACRWAPSGVSSYKDTNPIRLGSHPYDHFNIDYFFPPDTATVQGVGGLGLQHVNSVGTKFSLNIMVSRTICQDIQEMPAVWYPNISYIEPHTPEWHKNPLPISCSTFWFRKAWPQ